MNNFKTRLSLGTDKYINIPFEIKWDFYGRDDSIDEYQQKVVEEVIGEPKDFEILRFAHDKWGTATGGLGPVIIGGNATQGQVGDGVNVINTGGGLGSVVIGGSATQGQLGGSIGVSPGGVSSIGAGASQGQVGNDVSVSQGSQGTSGNNTGMTPDGTESCGTFINYNFHFFSGNPSSISSATDNKWVVSYLDSSYSGFQTSQLYYYEKPFTKSFFKLDFYDSNNAATQTNYITVIIPVQQGQTQLAFLNGYLPSVTVKTPSFILDYVGQNKEGFFIYWLRKRNFIDIDTFYVSAKFFDARIGEFIRMMVVPQSTLPQNKKFNFDESLLFYYKVIFNYQNKTYRYYAANDSNNIYRLGVNYPINWYEYVNPT